MLIVGAKGFAKEVLEIFHQKNETKNLCFYDDISSDIPDFLYNQFKVLKTVQEAKEYFEKTSAEFVLGIGNPQLRYKLTEKFQNLGGKLISSLSQFAEIGSFGIEIGEGCNILGGVKISNDVKIGKGTIVYYNSIITHDVTIGKFCEISPGATLLGRCEIGKFVKVGAGAIIFPDVKIGDNSVIASGAVVRNDIPKNSMAAGVPAEIKKNTLDLKKKSILFVADRPDWAYHNLIKTWGDDLKEFDCYVTFEEDFNIRAKNFSFSEKLLTSLINLFKNSDKKFVIDSSAKFSYPEYKIPPVYEVNTGKKVEKTHFDVIFECAFYFQFMSVFPFTSDKKFVGIYTDSFPHEGPSFDEKTKTDLKKLSRKEFFEKYLKPYDGVIVGSSGLYNDYKGLTDKITFTNGIFLQDEFVENKNIGEKEGLTIGWTGNPNRPMKGFREVIEPVIEEVNKTGRKVFLKTKFSGPYKDLLTFYSDVDVIAIASEADTGPSLFAEASLSKVPAISTKIGFPKMIIEDGVNGIIIKRDIEEMKNAIIKLYDDRALLKSFSGKIKQDYLQQLDNKISIDNLRNLFS